MAGTVTEYAPVSWQRISDAVEKVRRRLLRAVAALDRAKIPYAVGFVYCHVASVDMFLDGENAKARDSVHIVFAAEKVREDYVAPTPDVLESENTESFRLLSLEALIRMKLTSFRDKDRVHLRDLMEVGLVDASWLDKISESLRPRLRQILDSPEG